MSETYNFTVQLSTYEAFAQFHEEYTRFLQWRTQRAATRDTDRRGRHVRAIHARARQMRERDPSQPYRILFSLAACQIGGEEDCDADAETVNRNVA